MSVIATTTVSTSPWSTRWRRSSTVRTPPFRSGKALELPLGRGQLLRAALDLRAGEPVLRGDQPPDAGEAQDDEHGDRRVVERARGDRADLGQHEQDRDEDDPGH